MLSTFHTLVLVTALSSNYVFVTLVSQGVNYSHYFELLDLMLKMESDTLTGESSRACPPLGATRCPLFHKDPPWDPFAAHCVPQQCRGRLAQPAPEGSHPVVVF